MPSLLEQQSDGVRTALTRPETYGSDDEVTVCETHVSVVHLAGDRAYKLKKPIVLPFLDYGSPERRRVMCEEEVRLNRRLAPDVYLGVRAVVPAGEGYRLAEAGSPWAVDHVVEMRRFDPADTLAGRLRSGDVEEDDIRAVGACLAAFHAAAPEVPPTGRPLLAAERRVAANAHELLAAVEHQAEIGRVLALERFAHSFLASRAGAIDARARRGRVREGHGDLRAEHVLLGDPVQVVDCVEFDRGLREIDVAEDLAFLVMDLAAHGAERFVPVLVDAYRAAGGDPGDDALLAFHAAHRALVRAKVALLRAGQLEPGGPEHGRQSAEARDLLALAERFAWTARLPLAIVICGVPASGKSSLAQALAAASGLPHLSSDVTRKQLAGLQPTDRVPATGYTAAAGARTYAELGRRAAGAVRHGGGVVVDATFRRRADRDAFAGAFAAAAPVLFVECRVPVGELVRRAALRDADPSRISDADLPVVVGEQASWQPLDEVAAAAHLSIRADRPVEALVEELQAAADRALGRGA